MPRRHLALRSRPHAGGISAFATELLGYAHEDVLFKRDADGVWKFHTRKVGFLAGAKQLPIGTLPKDLPWDKEE